MTARIYKPARSAMQSGRGKTKMWLLEFQPHERRGADPLMGWVSSGDTQTQVKLWFETREAAAAYAERQGIAYEVSESAASESPTMSYSDNFKFTRIGQWTH